MLNLLQGVNLNLVFLIIGVVLLLMLLPKPFKFFLRFTSQGVVGFLAIIGLNFLLLPLGIGVGINLVTLGVAAVLGVPGVVSLYILEAFLL